MRAHEIFETMFLPESVGGNAALLQYFSVHPVSNTLLNGIFATVWDEYKEQNFDADVSYDAISNQDKRAFADYLVNSGYIKKIHEESPSLAPSWSLMQPLRKALLPNSTWLAHYCDNAEKIQREGFRIGAPDIDRLALTRHGSVRSKQPGYNFAYPTDGSVQLTSRWGPIPHGYGKQVLLFQSAGLSFYHSGDRENQVVFWGPSVSLETSHVIKATARGFRSGDLSARTVDELVEHLAKKTDA
jgi:hypothetical protein